MAQVKVRLRTGSGSFYDPLSGLSIANTDEKWVEQDKVQHLINDKILIVVSNLKGVETAKLESEILEKKSKK